MSTRSLLLEVRHFRIHRYFCMPIFLVLIVLLLFLRFDCLRSGDGLADTCSKYSPHYFIVVPICFVVVAFDLDQH